ncbi:MAG: hypothetical protein JW801_15085 [Bacteroidales bacterium]|nr:hypothetical protein [Bacteroidales bacterium]
MPSPYLLIPIGLLVLSCYLLSHVFVRFDILSKRNHRRFWNIVLLLTFLVAGSLGLLLAIQINYKLEWTLINNFLTWHVNFGIAMTIVAIIHFLWHLNYYLNLFKRGPVPAGEKAEEQHVQPKPDPRQKLLILFTGFYSPVVQVLMIRELTTQFQSNEIMMTWTLGLWMILTGTGSLLGRKLKLYRINPVTQRRLVLWISIAPVVMVMVLSLLKDILFPPGILISPLEYLLLISYMLAPVCIFSGVLFTCFVRSETYSFSGVYLLEAAGSIAGGILVSFILIRWFSVLQSLLLMIVLASLFLRFYSGKRIYILTGTLTLALAVFLPASPFEKNLKSVAFGDQKVVENEESRLGNITVTENGGEYNYFLNGSLLFNTGNFVMAEEFVHYAMLQHDDPKKVLLVSGGLAGMVNEILKYPDIRLIDYVELNTELLELSEKRNPLPDTSILHVHPSDILDFLRKTGTRYDIAILAVPDPSSIQLNRYYSVEFIRMLKGYLGENAVIIYGLSPTGNYMSRWQKLKLSLVCNSLKKHFRNVILIPGEKDYFVASDQEVSTAIAGLSRDYELENLYVNPDYFDDEDLRMRSLFLSSQLDKEAGVNSQHKALPAFCSTLKYLSKTGSGLPYLLIPLILLPLVLLLQQRGTKGMYLAGMSGASVEIMLIFMVQIAFGYIYQVLGILIAIFMGGLVLGTWLTRYIPVSGRNYRLAFLAMVAFLLLFFLFMFTPYITFPRAILWSIFSLSMLAPSAITGYIFVAATQLFREEITAAAPRMYAADLIGAALGITSMTLVLIPLIGLTYSCLILIALNAIPLFAGKKII